jgi:DNA-directed RNA polymerase I, II, and III subunit RPABC2
MSDNESFAGGSDSDNDSIFSDDGLPVTNSNLVGGGVNPLIKSAIKNTNDSDEDDDESIVGSEDEYDAKGADERDDIDYDFDPAKEDDDDDTTQYNKNIIIGESPLPKSLLQMDEDDDDDDEDGESYLQKFNSQVNKNYITDFHPECLINNYEEIAGLTKIVRDSNGNIIDDLHRTIPFLTKYEKARILGQRAKQINTGAKAFIKVPPGVIDGYIIANVELLQKRLPFIIRRPIAGGGCEYWNLKDLENIAF